MATLKVGSLFDRRGRRKYLNEFERKQFAIAAERVSLEMRCFCFVIHHTGCRVSEALNLRWENVSFDEQIIVFRSQKKRGALEYRAIPIPTTLIYDLRALAAEEATASEKIWKWHRSTGWKKVKLVFRNAGISGPQSCPRPG